MVRPRPSPAESTARPIPERPGRLVHGDALAAARGLATGSIDLVYLDPPFFTGKEQRGRGPDPATYTDRWPQGLDGYLAWLVERLAPCRDLLTPTGSMYVHLDWHAVHYAKVELDRLFGYRNFLNEIVWLYGLGGSSARYWPRKHDTLLWYARNAGKQHFEAARVPATSRRMQGRSKKAPDYWDIPALNNMSGERVGYPTQKPEALLRRIVESSAPPGGLVADFFCGSGTSLVVAEKTGRRWVGADVSPQAIAVTRARLERLRARFEIEGA